MEYEIIRGEAFFQVEQEVNNNIKEGWLPLGGLCFIDGFTAQAMTRTVKQKKEPVKRFQKPTKAELQAHKADKGLNFDVNAFIDHYESCDWVIGKNKPMKSWTHSVSNWIRNHKKFSPTAQADSRVNTVQPKQFDITSLDNSANKLTKEQIAKLKKDLIR